MERAGNPPRSQSVVDLQDRRQGAYDNVVPPPADPGKEHATPHERAQHGGAIQPETAPFDESIPEGLKRPRQGPLSPTRGRGEIPSHVPEADKIG